MRNKTIIKIILKAFFIFLETLIDAFQEEIGGAENGETTVSNEPFKGDAKGAADI